MQKKDVASAAFPTPAHEPLETASDETRKTAKKRLVFLSCEELEQLPSFDAAPYIDREVVRRLSESILQDGLLLPPVISSEDLLVCGHHRRAAIIALHAARPDAYARHFPRGVPVLRRPFAARSKPARAT